MTPVCKYLVGSRPVCLNDLVPATDRKDTGPAKAMLLTIYYQDTRKSPHHARDGFSNYFTSSTHVESATLYDTYEEAEAWNQEWLHGEGAVYRT